MERTAEISSQGLQTKLELSAEYAELTRTGDATSAETFIANQLVEAVDEGEVDELPGLYAHRAVWRLQLGRASKAEKDLHAALRGHLSPDAAFEVRLLLVECYRAQDRHGEADSALRQAQESLANKPVLSALTLRHMLNVSSGRQASNGLAPEQSGESIASTRSPPMPAPVDQNQQVSANSNGAAAKPKTEAQQPPAKEQKDRKHELRVLLVFQRPQISQRRQVSQCLEAAAQRAAAAASGSPCNRASAYAARA